MREASSTKLKENRPERCCLLESTSVGGNQAKKIWHACGKRHLERKNNRLKIN